MLNHWERLAGFVHSTKTSGARTTGQNCAGCWGAEVEKDAQRGINTTAQVLPGEWGE